MIASSSMIRRRGKPRAYPWKAMWPLNSPAPLTKAEILEIMRLESKLKELRELDEELESAYHDRQDYIQS